MTAAIDIRIVLPAHNEAAALPGLLDGLGRAPLPAGCLTVIVVDDGSTDGTAGIAQGRPAPPAVRLIRHARNMGLAAALRTGITAAVADAGDGAMVVTMDADGTHDPADVPRLVAPVLAGGLDVAVGSRFAPGGGEAGVPPHRRVLSRGAATLLRMAAPIRGVLDYTSGFRAYRAAVLKRILSEAPGVFDARGFSVTAALLLAAARTGARIGEVPVIVRYDRKAGPSKMPVAETIRGTVAVAAAFRRGGDGPWTL